MSRDAEMRSAQFTTQKFRTLYRELKLVSMDHGVTVRRALREAIHIWIDRNNGGPSDMGRYEALKIDFDILMKTLRLVEKCGIDATENTIRAKFMEAYAAVKETLSQF